MLHDLLLFICCFHWEGDCSSACPGGIRDNFSAQSHKQILCKINIFCFSERNSMNKYAKVYSPLAGMLFSKLGAFCVNDINLKDSIVILVLFTKYRRNIFDLSISLRLMQDYRNWFEFTRQLESRTSRMSKWHSVVCSWWNIPENARKTAIHSITSDRIKSSSVICYVQWNGEWIALGNAENAISIHE